MSLTSNYNISAVDGPLNISISRLRADLRGRVITPDDPDYDAARVIQDSAFDRHPALIIRAADAVVVAHVVSLAHEAGIELAVRSGGHSFAGHSATEGGIVLDLSHMKGLEIDVENRTAWAEAGLTAGEYTDAAHEYGLATGFGDAASVGIAGLTLGGGIGFLVRKHGLTIDNLLAVEIVTADGNIRLVDAVSHPDLFWALRGGGGNFGVVTRFKYQLHDVGTVVGGMLILPATADNIRAIIAQSEAAPEELSVILNVMTAPPLPFLAPEYYGQVVAMAMMVYAGDVDEGMRVVAPFREIDAPIVDMIGPMPYPAIYPPMDGPRASHALRSFFTDELAPDAAEVILEHLHKSTAMMSVAQIRVLGGAMARVPAEATAFAHRNRKYMAVLFCLYPDLSEADQHNAWVQSFYEALNLGEDGVYVNFVGKEGKARVRDAYPNYERLAAIKAHYDPTNFFYMNHNVEPDAE